MKGVYRADATTHIFTSSDVVADDYQLQANETFENPSGKLEPVQLINGSWVSATQADHDAWVKQQQAESAKLFPQVGPTDQQKLNASVNVQLAQLAKQNQEQAKVNAKLTLDLAKLMKQAASTGTTTNA